ncbi:gamma-glutamyltransferase [Roseivirga sp. BDSF3-8]|uniref:gamma-glutamyltransferase n=1 Tax=Roseivirga sp. BDSF3-8 TaxID=3241598 RepID=UPI003531962C
MRHIFLLTFLLIAFGCQQEVLTESAPSDLLPEVRGLLADSAMVVSAHPLASEAGLNILQKGGNAVDAAVAVQFALAVVFPVAGNIGGGGFMIYRDTSGESYALDFREKAPQAATETMYQNEAGEVLNNKSRRGHLAVGIPGSVAGMAEAHRKYGALPFNELLQPAIRLAEKGFVLTRLEAEGLQNAQSYLNEVNTIPPDFFVNDNWEPGDTIFLPELATTLRRIADTEGKDFYEGQTARLLVEEMKRGQGIVTLDDLANYRAVWRDPVKIEYKGQTLLSMPPPSSGGIVLGEILNMVAPHPLEDYAPYDVRTIHLLTEAERRAYADRAKHMGDSDFYPVPKGDLLSPTYALSRMQNFDSARASSSKSIGPGLSPPQESEQTTHFSIVDKDGRAVSVTTTLNGGYGSGVVVSGAGFLLNNEMDDFSIKPGVPNMYGLIGGTANAIEPGKRMLSSMTPTIVEKNGKLRMVLGTPGGSTIITSVLQVFLRVSEHGMSMQQAVNSPRFHHQWLPDIIKAEEGAFDEETVKRLQEMGHKIETTESIGRVDAILITDDGTLEGGADPRGDDTAKGY